MIRLVIADDQALVRAGLRMVLETADDLTVVGEAEDGVEALAMCRAHQPDVVLMDIRMPRLDGIEATRQLIASAPENLRVLMLTTFDTDEFLYRALVAGASGFLLKTASPDRLIEAVRCVQAGESLLAPTITRRLIERFLNQPPQSDNPPLLAELTAREREVLTLIGRGRSNTEIAEALVVAETTIKTHVNRIKAKLAIRDRAQAVVVAYESGLVRPGQG